MRPKLFLSAILCVLVAFCTVSTVIAVPYDLFTRTFSNNTPGGLLFFCSIVPGATGAIPDSITRVAIRAPDSSVFDTDTDPTSINYYPCYRHFLMIKNEADFVGGSIPSGQYFIRVWDTSGRYVTVKENVSINPLPVPQNIYPAPDDPPLNTTTPIFSWDPVPGAKRYRVWIAYQPTVPFVYEYWTTFTKCKIPRWILNLGRGYYWQLQAFDSIEDVQNSSGTDWMYFSINP